MHLGVDTQTQANMYTYQHVNQGNFKKTGAHWPVTARTWFNNWYDVNLLAQTGVRLDCGQVLIIPNIMHSGSYL